MKEGTSFVALIDVRNKLSPRIWWAQFLRYIFKMGLSIAKGMSEMVGISEELCLAVVLDAAFSPFEILND